MEEAEARKTRLNALRANADNSHKDGSLRKQQLLPPPNFSNSLMSSHNNSNNNSNGDNASELPSNISQSPKFNFYTNPMAGYTHSNGRERKGMGATPQASLSSSSFTGSYNNSGTITGQWNQHQPVSYQNQHQPVSNQNQHQPVSYQNQHQPVPYQNQPILYHNQSHHNQFQWNSGAPPVQEIPQQGVSHLSIHSQRNYGSSVESCQAQNQIQSFQRQGFPQGQGFSQGHGATQQGQGSNQVQGYNQRQDFTKGQGFSGSLGNNMEVNQRANVQKWQSGKPSGRREGNIVGVGVGVDTNSGSFRGTKSRRYGEACARERPDLYYSKSMVEDPWKGL